MIDRPGLADFLRRRRELLRPADVGMPPGVRRRTPGLRREEVALLAGVSTDHYTRLEQARGSAPSESVVTSLARALRLDPTERDHLFHLAGLAAPRRHGSGHISPGLIAIATRLVDVPIAIVSDLGEVLWHNALLATLFDWEDPGPGVGRNLVWVWFTDPRARERFPEEARARLTAAHVGDLRATAARRAGDQDVTTLVEDLRRDSPEFREHWDRHEVGVRQSDRKDMTHPEVGLIRLRCEVLLTPDAEHALHAFFPIEGTDAREKLDLLRVIGAQRFEPTP
ncbi:helix-turn-helix transcriptional regulator [Nocardioides insulae]|uniref:helix-turn-helix transcriptional regulator n=1 Tax=Nocardioides insulae TaxID=394734 RepID=UPI001B7FE4A7|nr:helix-turn-helix transcriptional regulator [Nocardioides insulae]